MVQAGEGQKFQRLKISESNEWRGFLFGAGSIMILSSSVDNFMLTLLLFTDYLTQIIKSRFFLA